MSLSFMAACCPAVSLLPAQGKKPATFRSQDVHISSRFRHRAEIEKARSVMYQSLAASAVIQCSYCPTLHACHVGMVGERCMRRTVGLAGRTILGSAAGL